MNKLKFLFLSNLINCTNVYHVVPENKQDYQLPIIILALCFLGYFLSQLSNDQKPIIDENDTNNHVKKLEEEKKIRNINELQKLIIEIENIYEGKNITVDLKEFISFMKKFLIEVNSSFSEDTINNINKYISIYTINKTKDDFTYYIKIIETINTYSYMILHASMITNLLGLFKYLLKNKKIRFEEVLGVNNYIKAYKI